MLLGSLNTVVTSLLRGKTLPPTAAAPAQANAAERAEKAAKDTPSAAPATPGVVFDLSEAALQAVAAASDSKAGTAAVTTAPQDPSPFLPAGMTIAAEIAALKAPAAAASSSIAGAASPAVQETGTTASPFKAGEAADPDEEARARAHAIQAQEREQVLSLVEQLAEARAEVPAFLKAPAQDAAAEGKATPAAA